MCRIEYSSSFNTSISKLDEKRERDQRNGLICAKLKPGSHLGFFDLGFAAPVKAKRFSWSVYSSLCPVESLKLSRYYRRHEFWIDWED